MKLIKFIQGSKSSGHGGFMNPHDFGIQGSGVCGGAGNEACNGRGGGKVNEGIKHYEVKNMKRITFSTRVLVHPSRHNSGNGRGATYDANYGSLSGKGEGVGYDHKKIGEYKI